MFPTYLNSEAMENTQLIIKYINTYTSESNISFNLLRRTYRILTYNIQAYPLQIKFKKQSDSSHPLVTSRLIGSNIPLNTLLSKHIQFMYYSQDERTNNRTGEILAVRILNCYIF